VALPVNGCATEFSMARTLGEVIANARAERRDKIAADYVLKLLAEEQKRIAVEKKWRSEEAKPVLETGVREGSSHCKRLM
jgi:hypothetical protein